MFRPGGLQQAKVGHFIKWRPDGDLRRNTLRDILKNVIYFYNKIIVC